MFEVPAATFFSAQGVHNFYDVAWGDERFLMARYYGVEDAAPSLILVLKFFEELKRLVPN